MRNERSANLVSIKMCIKNLNRRINVLNHNFRFHVRFQILRNMFSENYFKSRFLFVFQMCRYF